MKWTVSRPRCFNTNRWPPSFVRLMTGTSDDLRNRATPMFHICRLGKTSTFEASNSIADFWSTICTKYKFIEFCIFLKCVRFVAYSFVVCLSIWIDIYIYITTDFFIIDCAPIASESKSDSREKLRLYQ